MKLIHLHVHSERGSILDSILTVKDIVKFAKDNNQSSVAITDHGSMAAFVEHWKECDKNGVKPIIGCEVYEADDMNIKTETKENKLPRYHLILLAKNEKGLNNLFKIVSAGYLYGFYKKPRIDLDYIETNNLGEGIVCLTACMAGRLSRFAQGVIDNKYTTKSYIEKLKSIFDYVALEIQSHDIPEQIELNKKIINYAERSNTPYVVTCDAHMLTAEQQEAHGVFVQIGTAREVGETYEDCYLQTEDEVHNKLDKHHGVDVVNKAIAETHKIADMIESFGIGIDGINHMPKIKIPAGFKSNMEYFRHIIDTNFPIKFGHMTEEQQQIRRERIEMEIPVLEALGYIDYFLMLNMLTVEAKKRKIPLGYSRGSGGNCLCLFMLDVTQIDSVRWNLDFSRFANLGRKSVADYDMDISQSRRKEMIKISEDLFGKEKVSPICTFGVLSTKVAIKDIGKVLNDRGVYEIPYSLRDEVSKLIPTIKTINDLGESEEKETLLRDVLLVNQRLKEVNEQYPLWFKLVMDLEGKTKSLGQHACFEENTLITTNNGLKKIKDISVGDLVLTHERRFMPVVDLVSTETDEVYFVKSNSSFEVEVTGNHPFYIREMKYVKTKSKNGNKSQKKTFGEPKWKSVEELSVGSDYVGIPINKESIIPKNKLNLPFENKSFWWIVGRYLGDGWTELPKVKRKYGYYEDKRVIICCDFKTEAHVNNIKEHLDKLGFSYRVEESTRIYKIYINDCKDLFDYLQTFGKYAHGKKINDDVLNLPTDYLESFMDGYLSSDGYYEKKRGIYSFKTVSKDLAIGLMQVVNKVYKRHSKVTITKGGTENILGRICNVRDKYTVSFTKDVRQKEQSFYENGYIWSRVSYIKKEKKSQNMFNLTVLNDSSYVANGICVHNCGTIIAPKSLINYSPLCLNKENHQMLQLEMHDSMDELGLCKMDFLGLLTLDIVDDCLKMAGLTWNDVDINHLDLDDKDVFENIYRHGNTVGIFQMESHEAINMCIKVGVDNIEDVIAVNALNRPGTAAGVDAYVRNKYNPELAELVHEDLRPIFEATHSVLLYQEQALQIFRLAGFSEDLVDNARRSIGKKIPEEMRALKGKFSLGLKKRGWNDSQIDEIWALMEKQAEYSFNRGHSVAYGLLSYLTAYLKHYYPVEFMTACLNAKLDDAAKTGILLNECKRLGIKVSPPNINKSMNLYTPNTQKKEILFGLQPVKGLGETASDFIIKNRPYNNLEDFFDKMSQKGSPVNKAGVVTLIKAGALPVKSKNQTLKKYAEYLVKGSVYKPVSTLPPKAKLKNDFGIIYDNYPTKQAVLDEYNKIREQQHQAKEDAKKQKSLAAFKEKYVGDSNLYEFETLGMFLTDNPFDEVSKDIIQFDEVGDGSQVTVVCSVVDVKKKKDKNNKPYAYLDVYTIYGIIEAISWASSYSVYSQLLKKGSHVAILGKKSEDKLIVSKVKPFEQWKQDRNKKVGA